MQRPSASQQTHSVKPAASSSTHVATNCQQVKQRDGRCDEWDVKEAMSVPSRAVPAQRGIEDGGKRSKCKLGQGHDTEKSWDKGLRHITEQRLRFEQRDQRQGEPSRIFPGRELGARAGRCGGPGSGTCARSDVCDNSRNRCSSRVHNKSFSRTHSEWLIFHVVEKISAGTTILEISTTAVWIAS